MKRMYSVPTIGLILALLLAGKLTQAQTYFSVEVKGKGKPMILIPGLFCSGEVWKETVEHFQKKYECHVITIAGFGTVAPNLTENFLETVKNDIIAYTKDKKMKKPVILGHSLGGFLSYWVAASAPDLYGKVIAVDGLPFFPAIMIPGGATVETAKPMATNMRNMITSQSNEQTAASQKVMLANLISNSERIDQVAAMASKADLKTQGQVAYEMYTTDLRPTIASINCPVLVLGAWVAFKNYGVTHESTMKNFEDQVALIKNCTIELTDTGKHFIFYDEPAWFYERVENFLK
ncbi:MAG: alpha/beta fold hydrolase [Bacteroidota bacterium]